MTLTRRQLQAVALVASLALAACGDDDSAPSPRDGSVAACNRDNPCGDGLVCVDERCVAGGDVDVVIGSSVRGCEVLLEDGDGAQAVDVRFGEGVKGSFVRHAPRLALSFVATGDEAVSASDVVPVAVGSGVPKLLKTACIDKAGKALPKSAFEIGGQP
ncbi:MAG TPA: hypothetical protein VK509_13975 [Polyangiales bacterium]|nr:hypothetical protein [Polyangiales bacterium]